MSDAHSWPMMIWNSLAELGAGVGVGVEAVVGLRVGAGVIVTGLAVGAELEVAGWVVGLDV